MHVYAAARNAKLPMGNILGPDQMVVKDPNDQTFDHQTFDDLDPGAGGWGVQRACMYRYQGLVHVFLAGGLLHMLMFIFRVRSSDDLGGRRQNHTIFIWCDCPKHDRYSGPPDQNGTLQG